MASVCRDDSCLRSFHLLHQRNSHEALMHPALIQDAAIRLIQRIVNANSPQKCRTKIIHADGELYSYDDALRLTANPEKEETQKILSVFKSIVNDFFLDNPEYGIRELLTIRQYNIRG